MNRDADMIAQFRRLLDDDPAANHGGRRRAPRDQRPLAEPDHYGGLMSTHTARWRTWHVVVLGVLLAMLAGVVAIAVFGDADTGEIGSAEPATSFTRVKEAQPTDQLPSKESKLRVAPEGDRTGYDRDRFGDYNRQWALENNLRLGDWTGCDAYYSVADDQCYTDPADLDVDHFVPLAEAWDSGASEWTRARREGFARDPINLWLMTDNLNQSKGDSDVAEWVPPHALAVCDYLARWVEVKRAYDLTVDQGEVDALTELAASC